MSKNRETSAGDLLSGMRIGIVGLGLMGGSLALALRGRVAGLVAIERQADIRQLALRQGVVDEAVDAISDGAPAVDLLVLATPIRTIVDTIGRLPSLYPNGCAVIDLGSTKRDVVAAMNALPDHYAAIGGHPMCGRETAGLASATADLYRGQNFFLCPTRRATPALEATVLALIEALGARPIVMDAAAHDSAVAVVSHLPALLAASLMRSAADERLWTAAASGFRDTSRLAGSDTRMMLDILMTNRDAVLDALESCRAELAAMHDALAAGDEAALVEWLAAAQVSYAAYRRFTSAAHLLPAGGRSGLEDPSKIA